MHHVGTLAHHRPQAGAQPRDATPIAGIFGVVDPDGVSPIDVERRVARCPLYGAPVLAVASASAVLGILRRAGEDSPLRRGGSVVTVADARLDAWLEPPPPALGSSLTPAVDTLDAILGRVGPDGLSRLAGDFAVARYDASRETLTLARDAFGLRPLFIARSGRRFAFASDPELLVALGVASGDLDRATMTGYLALRPTPPEHTAFSGITRLPGGSALTVVVGSATAAQPVRWFRPEEIEPQGADPDVHAAVLREALVASVADRLKGAEGLLFLSGGRDSTAIALAADIAGVRLRCRTWGLAEPASWDDGNALVDGQLALALGREIGLSVELIPLPTVATTTQASDAVALAGTPLMARLFPLTPLIGEAVEATPGVVALSGEGGDSLFTTPNLVCLDLLRERRPRAALTAARGLRHWYGTERSGYGRIGRAVLRGVPLFGRLPTLPSRLSGPPPSLPPWLNVDSLGPSGPRKPLRPERGAQEIRLKWLADLGCDYSAEEMVRLARGKGGEYARPLLDLRVVRAALRAPVTLHAPDPALKPMLRRAIIREHDARRVKANARRHVEELSRTVASGCGDLLGPGMLAGEEQLMRSEPVGEGLHGEPILLLVGLEAWLRQQSRKR